MPKTLHKIADFLKELFVKFVEDNSLNYCGSIGFFTIFSLPGVMVIVFAMAISVFEEELVSEELYHQMQAIIGHKGAFNVQSVITNLRSVEFSWWAAAIVLGTLLYGATSVFISIQDGINVIWGLRPRPKRVALKFVLNRTLSLAMVICIGFLMLVSLSIDTVLVVFKDALINRWGADPVLMIQVFHWFFSLIVVFAVFFSLYTFLPDGKPQMNWLLMGSGVSTALYFGGKYLFTLYLANTSLSQAYGATGSLVLLLLWVYYASIILLFGAEFIEVISRRNGDLIKPGKHAVKIITKVVNLE